MLASIVREAQLHVQQQQTNTEFLPHVARDIVQLYADLLKQCENCETWMGAMEAWREADKEWMIEARKDMELLAEELENVAATLQDKEAVVKWLDQERQAAERHLEDKELELKSQMNKVASLMDHMKKFKAQKEDLMATVTALTQEKENMRRLIASSSATTGTSRKAVAAAERITVERAAPSSRAVRRPVEVAPKQPRARTDSGGVKREAVELRKMSSVSKRGKAAPTTRSRSRNPLSTEDNKLPDKKYTIEDSMTDEDEDEELESMNPPSARSGTALSSLSAAPQVCVTASSGSDEEDYSDHTRDVDDEPPVPPPSKLGAAKAQRQQQLRSTTATTAPTSRGRRQKLPPATANDNSRISQRTPLKLRLRSSQRSK